MANNEIIENEIAFNSLELNDDRYVVKITAEKASELGISKENYEKLLSDLRKTNDIKAMVKSRLVLHFLIS